MSAATEQGVLDAVKARLLVVGVVGLDLSEITEPYPAQYAELHVAFEANPALSMDGSSNVESFVVGVRSCATTLGNVREVRERVSSALSFVPLAIGAAVSTPPQRDPGEMADKDEDGYWSAYDEYTLTFC